MEHQQKLLNYISQQVSQAKTPNEIWSQLLAAGWPETELRQAFLTYQSQTVPTTMQPPTAQHITTMPQANGKRKGRIRNGWQLLKHCIGLLNGNRYLLRYFFITWALIITINAIFACLIWFSDPGFYDSEANRYILYLGSYLIVFCVVNFYAAALARNILDIYKGERKNYAEYIKAARARFIPILVYSLISAVIGVILQYIVERMGWLGRLISWLLGTAWSLATMFTLPIIMDSDASGTAAIRQSWGLFKKTWGEGITAKAAVGAPITLLQILLAFIFVPPFYIALFSGSLALALIALAIYLFLAISLAVIGSYASNFINAALYYYALHKQVPPGFSEDMLNQVFIKSKRQLKKEAKATGA